MDAVMFWLLMLNSYGMLKRTDKKEKERKRADNGLKNSSKSPEKFFQGSSRQSLITTAS